MIIDCLERGSVWNWTNFRPGRGGRQTYRVSVDDDGNFTLIYPSISTASTLDPNFLTLLAPASHISGEIKHNESIFWLTVSQVLMTLLTSPSGYLVSK